MRPLIVALVLLAGPGLANLAAQPLAEARRLYNLGQHETAERTAREATESPNKADAGRVVLGRIQLERYVSRRILATLPPLAIRYAWSTPARSTPLSASSSPSDSPRSCLEDKFGAAAEMFESVRQRSALLGPAAHERVLDWWATALDRQAQTRPSDERFGTNTRNLDRMSEEIAEYPWSTAAGYWIAAGARASGDIERAWHAALAGWLRATLADDRGAALRADLDRLVTQAIIPERAARLAAKGGDAKQARSSMTSEWEAFKRAWNKWLSAFSSQLPAPALGRNSSARKS
jgi:hypothetical protein